VNYLSTRNVAERLAVAPHWRAAGLGEPQETLQALRGRSSTAVCGRCLRSPREAGRNGSVPKLASFDPRMKKTGLARYSGPSLNSTEGFSRGRAWFIADVMSIINLYEVL